jgi:hypothetical protein
MAQIECRKCPLVTLAVLASVLIVTGCARTRTPDEVHKSLRSQLSLTKWEKLSVSQFESKGFTVDVIFVQSTRKLHVELGLKDSEAGWVDVKLHNRYGREMALAHYTFDSLLTGMVKIQPHTSGKFHTSQKEWTATSDDLQPEIEFLVKALRHARQ